MFATRVGAYPKRVLLAVLMVAGLMSAVLAPVAAPSAHATVVGTAGLFVPVQGRLVDSRVPTGTTLAPFAAMTARTIQVTGQAGVPDSGVSAVMATFTAVDPSVAGQLAAGNADGDLSGVMRYEAGGPTSNSSIVMVSGTGQINVQATTPTNVVVDIQGYYTKGNGVTADGGYAPVTMARLVDTVNGVGVPKAKLAGGSTSSIQVSGRGGVPTGAKAAFVSFQVTNAPGTPGFINPYATSSTARPEMSLNFDHSLYTTIGAIVPLADDGSIKLYLSPGNTIDLLMDVEGYFIPGGDSTSSGFFTPAIQKIYDTRSNPAHVAPGATVTVAVGGAWEIPAVADGLSAVTVNLTVTDLGPSGGYARAWPSGTTEPTNVGTLALNKGTTGSMTTNLATVPVGADNAIKIHNVSLDSVDFIVDLQGWYKNPPAENVTSVTPVTDDNCVAQVQAAAAASGDVADTSICSGTVEMAESAPQLATAADAEYFADANIVAEGATNGPIHWINWTHKYWGGSIMEVHQGRTYYDGSRAWIARYRGYAGYHTCHAEGSWAVGWVVTQLTCAKPAAGASADAYDRFDASVAFKGSPVTLGIGLHYKVNANGSHSSWQIGG